MNSMWRIRHAVRYPNVRAVVRSPTGRVIEADCRAEPRQGCQVSDECECELVLEVGFEAARTGFGVEIKVEFALALELLVQNFANKNVCWDMPRSDDLYHNFTYKSSVVF